MTTAALVLVGSELVRGHISDENREFLSRELTGAGVSIVSIHILRDEVDAVAEFVRYLSSRVRFVITVGGLGPTLDDVTLEAVARAFGLSLERRQPQNAEDYARMSGSETRDPLLRHVPMGSEIIPTADGPIIRTYNVYSLPGLPRLVRARFPTLKNRLQVTPISTRIIQVQAPQSRIASALEDASKQFQPVTIGCYPGSDAVGGTEVRLEGGNLEDVNSCVLFLEAALTELDLQFTTASQGYSNN